LNCINCNPVPLWNQEPPSRGALNSRLASVDSGNPVGSGGSRYTVSQRRSGPRGLFSRAEDKVKLSNDEIEQACTRPATVVHLYFTRSAILSAFCRTNHRFKFQNAVSFSSARTTKRSPLSRCASAIQIDSSRFAFDSWKYRPGRRSSLVPHSQPWLRHSQRLESRTIDRRRYIKPVMALVVG
jgi:hypothetical protein